MTKNPVTSAILDVAKAFFGLGKVVVRDAPSNTAHFITKLTCKIEGHHPKYGQHLEGTSIVTSVICQRCEQDLYYNKVAVEDIYNATTLEQKYVVEYHRARSVVEDV